MTFLDHILTDKVNYIALAVPAFFLLIGVEVFYAWWAKKDYYRLDDSINDLSCGIVEQVIGIFIKGGLFVGYLGLYRHCRLFEITNLRRRCNGERHSFSFWASTFAITGSIALPTR